MFQRVNRWVRLIKPNQQAIQQQIAHLQQVRRGLVLQANGSPDETARAMAYVRIREIGSELAQLAAQLQPKK